MSEHRSTDGRGSWTLVALSILVVATVLTVEALILLRGMPQNVDGVVLGRILGTMDSAMLLVLGFWFSASFSDRGKDAAIQSMARATGGTAIKTDDVSVEAAGDVKITTDGK